MSAYFVTSSGTGMGKTLVTAALCRQMRTQGKPVAALKPVISGYDAETALVSDTHLLIAAMGESVSSGRVAAMSPWRFKEPMSPDMAAMREGTIIPFDDLVAHCRNAIAQTDGAILIEGVGGVMVPLDESHTVLDWMTSLQIPALLVVGSYLGSLSHTLTAAKAILEANVPLAGVIVSESKECPVLVEETAETLGRFLPDVAIRILPRQENEIDWSAIPDLTDLLDGVDKSY